MTRTMPRKRPQPPTTATVRWSYADQLMALAEQLRAGPDPRETAFAIYLLAQHLPRSIEMALRREQEQNARMRSSHRPSSGMTAGA